MSVQSKQTKKRKKKKTKAKVEEKDTSIINILKEEGNNYFFQKKYEEAIASYSKAIEEDSNNPGSHILYSNRSAAYLAKEDFEEAIADAEKCIALQPSWPKGYYRKGMTLQGMFKIDEAEAAFARALEVEPDDKLLQESHRNILVLLEELRISGTESTSNDNPEEEKFRRFLRWLDDGDVNYNYLFIKYYGEDYRGVHMRASVPVDHVILEVPLGRIMTSEVAKASEIGMAIKTSGIDLISTHSYLACFLLQEKKLGKESIWYPYISTLPTEYRNMPIFFQPEEYEWMKGSFSMKKMQDQRDALCREYHNICSGIPSFSEFSLDDFIWARTAVITRIFGLQIKENKTDGLVPMADMLNHKRPRQTAWTFDNDRKSFTITSLEPVNRGDQVFDSYGRKCNSRFFVNYGFSLEHNEEDNEAVITVQLPRNDPLFSIKVNIIATLGKSATADFQMPTTYKEKKSKHLFSFLRVVYANQKQLLLIESSNDEKRNDGERDILPLSLTNEMECIRAISEAAEKRLGGFDTTLEEDYELLSRPDGTFTSNIRNAILMRKGEKEVLHYYRDLVDVCTPLFGLSKRDFSKTMQKLSYPHHEEEYKIYLQGVIAPLIKMGML